MMCLNKMCESSDKGYNGANLLIMKDGKVEHAWICTSCHRSLGDKDVRFVKKLFIKDLVDCLEKDDASLALHKLKTALEMFDE